VSCPTAPAPASACCATTSRPVFYEQNGYREYDGEAEGRVRQIRALLAAGLPTRVIYEVLPCARHDGTLRACPGVLPTPRARLSELDQRAADLDAARSLLRRTITTLAEEPARPTKPE
jgi:DNA-binding transcriptional MerR regulator